MRSSRVKHRHEQHLGHGYRNGSKTSVEEGSGVGPLSNEVPPRPPLVSRKHVLKFSPESPLSTDEAKRPDVTRGAKSFVAECTTPRSGITPVMDAFATPCIFKNEATSISAAHEANLTEISLPSAFATTGRYMSSRDIIQHNQASAEWIVLNNVVYDVKAFLKKHLSAEQKLMEKYYIGREIQSKDGPTNPSPFRRYSIAERSVGRIAQAIWVKYGAHIYDFTKLLRDNPGMLEALEKFRIADLDPNDPEYIEPGHNTGMGDLVSSSEDDITWSSVIALEPKRGGRCSIN